MMMLTPTDIDRITAVQGAHLEDREVNWLADQLLKADAFNKELLQQIYQLRQTLKMVL